MEGTVAYANFRAWVPRRVLPVGTLNPQEWVYYEWGPRQYQEPLVCVHGLVGSAESFFLQVLALAERGYRVISIQLPVYWSATEFCDGFHTFLDMVHVRRVHLYGAGLGGFLVMQYASRRPERVASMVLTHAFLSTDSVPQRVVYAPSILRWLPDVLVRSAVRGLFFPKGRVERPVAEAAEFSIVNTMAASRDQLASRLSMLGTPASVVGRVRIPEDLITMVDVFEFATTRLGAPAREELQTALPNVRRAMIKTGGDFPYLGAPDDVTLHLVVHLRRHAAPPAEPVAPPPPARPRPVMYVHRSTQDDEEAPNKSDVAVPEHQPPDFRVLAEEKVAAAEQKRKEHYTFELHQIQKYISDYDAPFFVNVLDDCEGSVDRAVQRIRDGQYKKNFHLKARKKAIRSAAENMRKDYEAMKALQQADEPAVAVPVEDAAAASAAVAAVEEAKQDIGARRAGSQSPVLFKDSPGSVCESAEIVANVSASRDQASSAVPERSVADTGPSVLSVALGTKASAGLETVSLDDEAAPKTDMVHDRHIAEEGEGEMLQSSSQRSTQEEKAKCLESKMPDGNREKSQKKYTGKRSSRARPKSRYPVETDSVSAYVTSEKVGMRAHESLVGRGPAPFASSVKADGSFSKTTSGGGWSQSSLLSNPAWPPVDETVDRARCDRGGGWSSSEDVPGVESLGLANDGRARASSSGVDSTQMPEARTLMRGGGEGISEHSSPLWRESRKDTGESILRSSGTDADDGWSDFRRIGGFAFREVSAVQSVSAIVQDEDSDEDSARLREWMMSAQSAKEHVQRQ